MRLNMFLKTIFLLFVVTLFYGCPSEELTSARLYVKENNWESVRKKCHDLVIDTQNQLLNYFDIEPLCPDSWLGQMASIQIPFKEPESLKNILLEKYKIQVPVFEWEGKVYLRFSVQAYNTCAELDCLIKAVKEILN